MLRRPANDQSCNVSPPSADKSSSSEEDDFFIPQRGERESSSDKSVSGNEIDEHAGTDPIQSAYETGSKNNDITDASSSDTIPYNDEPGNEAQTNNSQCPSKSDECHKNCGITNLLIELFLR